MKQSGLKGIHGTVGTVLYILNLLQAACSSMYRMYFLPLLCLSFHLPYFILHYDVFINLYLRFLTLIGATVQKSENYSGTTNACSTTSIYTCYTFVQLYITCIDKFYASRDTMAAKM